MDLVFPPPEEPSILALPLPHPEAYEGEPREYALALMQRRDAIQKEIDVLTGVLTSHGTTQSTSLVDNEGYPRGDIDIYAIRHARSSLVRLQTDRQTVNELLGNALNEAFAPGSSDSTQPNGNTLAINGHPPQPRAQPAEAWPEEAVVKVNSVAEGSPAAEAGLKAQDLVYSFAGITHASDAALQAIAAVVSRSENASLNPFCDRADLFQTALPLLILRGQEQIRISLTPRNGWGGRGSLGCHILPV
ncbi:hypothetical protein B9479_005246 [Cryptococcus floricola]|uniref:Probable 26S proteasome regulatory subunit p27 n=1 Tax=Cryptococcus floricola TaxID=2591691 RepID=A0A5D3ATW7_9TREE|nr:hypothetical protein B9479_005246 [Cryptococcus floricola]